MSKLIITKLDDKNEIIIEIQGTFDHLLHHDFRAAYRNEDVGFSYVINLHKTEYMNSSALGMLLLLREHLGSDKANISITGCRKNVLKILSIAGFDRLFVISQ